MAQAGIEEKFMSGVNRLLSMQTVNGGFSYWPGASEDTYWGTAYVTHVLLEGKEQGYPIPEERLDDALDFIERTLTNNPNKVDPKYGYSVAQSEPYMQYVLARAGRPRKGRLRYLIQNPPNDWGGMAEENLYLLKTALYLAGDRTYASDLKQPFEKKAVISDARVNGWNFWSDFRYRGVQLNLMEDLWPGSGEGEEVSQLIAHRLASTDNSWSFTTQELSWTVSALGKRSGGKANFKSASLVANGKTLKPFQKKKGDKTTDVTWKLRGASNAKSLQVDMKGLEGKVFAVVNVEGVKPGYPWKVGDHDVKVERSYVDADGNNLGLRGLHLGDVVYVKLTLTNLTSSKINNVVMLDRFGAGLEVENPRLGRGHANNIPLANKLWNLDYMDLRDDRVAFFGALQPGEKVHVIYSLRATVAGEFYTPPISAEAMYEPRQWSRHEGETIKISDPWDAI